MKIVYINNVGTGYARNVEVRDGMTVSEFFTQQMEGASPSEYNIRVNRNPVDAGHVLRDGDKVTVTPAKIAGARS